MGPFVLGPIFGRWENAQYAGEFRQKERNYYPLDIK
jgi:hypothetical protein